jgi:thiol-disulfide isomerase/thioredoxin
MRVQWLYVFEALFGLVGVLAAVLLSRRFQRGRERAGVRCWMAHIAIAGVSLLGLAGFAFLVLGAQRALGPGIAQNGHSLAAFRFQSVEDASWHSLGEYRGKVVLLNVWATWCGPCRGEVPELERVQRELGPKGVVVLMVSSEEPAVIREYLAQSPVRTEQGYVSGAPESRPITGIESRPLTFIVDRQGIAREFLIGTGNSKSFSELIGKYL